jgi:LmbE family N-acetylglucosaminyl deacetylase
MPRLALVFAHPDDDVWGNGGTLALHEGDLQTTVIVATSGEAGPIAEDTDVAREDLAGVREQEERDALAAVGAGEADLHFLRYPDGGLDEVPRDELVGQIAEILDRTRPQVVVTFGPEGITKHEDHIAVGQAATEAFHRLNTAATDGAFQRLYYNALPESALAKFWETLKAQGIDLGDPDGPFMPRGVPDHTITVEVDCTSVAERKMSAVRAHRTQAGELDSLPEDLRPDMFGREYFVQAWPPDDGSAGGTGGSIFEGLQG